MTVVLIRVDERLIHGQVTVGWGSRLRPDRYVVVDDALTVSEWEQELFRLGTPAGSQAEFVSVEQARERLESWRGSGERIFLLTRDLDHMVRLARGRRLAGDLVNLGGIHHRPGRDEVLPYLFLDEGDRVSIRELEKEGVTVSAQDLPGSPRTKGGRLLDD